MRILTVLALLSVCLVIHTYGACHWACNTCTGPAQTDCLTCATNFFIQPTDTSSPYECLPTCPAHYFGNNTTGRCQICDSSCYWCDYNATYCASCATNYFWTYADPHTCTPCNANCDGCWQSANNCVACKPGFTYNADHSCTQAFTCHATCATCSGPAINQCSSCPDGRFLTGTNRCNLCDATCAKCTGGAINQCSACPPGRFLNANNRCIACNSNCKECDGPATHCTACDDGEYLTGTNTCAACHADCETCSGPGNDQCLSCKSTGKTVQVGTKCYTPCTGTPQGGDIRCTTCAAGCRVAFGCLNTAENCVRCKAAYHRDNGHCVPNRRLLRI